MISLADSNALVIEYIQQRLNVAVSVGPALMTPRRIASSDRHVIVNQHSIEADLFIDFQRPRHIDVSGIDELLDERFTSI